MLTYIVDAPNIANKPFIEAHVEKYFDEVKSLLPELPNDISIWLDNWHMIDGEGEGGAAYQSDIMNISFDIDFKDKARQLKVFVELSFMKHFIWFRASRGRIRKRQR